MSSQATRIDRLARPLRLGFVCIAALSTSSLSGCGTMMQSLFPNASKGVVSAEPLVITTPQPAATASIDEKREFLGKVLMQSEMQCGEFVDRLVLGENATNTALDVAGTAFSALSTAFAPPGTKSALSAAATIATGSKTAIDADIYAKAAIADFATAIQKTYYSDMKTYIDALPSLAPPVVISAEIAKIQSYHAECALAPAESAIQTQLGTTTAKTPGNTGNQVPTPAAAVVPGAAKAVQSTQGTLSTTAAVPGHGW
jgi:hypothetical protein